MGDGVVAEIDRNGGTQIPPGVSKEGIFVIPLDSVFMRWYIS